MSHDRAYKAFKAGDINALREIRSKIGLPGKQMMVDIAVEEGKLPIASYLLKECYVCPSLYAVQMGLINGHANTVSLALSKCPTLHNDTDIKQVHYNYKTNKWDDVIPEEFR